MLAEADRRSQVYYSPDVIEHYLGIYFEMLALAEDAGRTNWQTEPRVQGGPFGSRPPGGHLIEAADLTAALGSLSYFHRAILLAYARCGGRSGRAAAHEASMPAMTYWRHYAVALDALCRAINGNRREER